ncbi:hypothetical protein KP509_05G063500 [Ceratopteris richardii]|uniref:Thioredoxin domain-containing protein n=1 Tax=Ceratopteris richardii TaxID=49495 RepID=A0A8T2UV20_CERRI|nr:hypothetical protein KP509_05G063500 [Ceratopteris richardii]
MGELYWPLETPSTRTSLSYQASTRRSLGGLSSARHMTLLQSIRCASAQQTCSGHSQCMPTPQSRSTTHQSDWNSRMLFNRGMNSVKAVDKDSLWSALEAAGDKPVVLDMYSRWCGPCRLIYPKLVQLSETYPDVVFLKLDCSSENKTIFSKLGIGILPTFKIFKKNSLLSEVKGAKYDDLVQKIERARVI